MYHTVNILNFVGSWHSKFATVCCTTVCKNWNFRLLSKHSESYLKDLCASTMSISTYFNNLILLWNANKWPIQFFVTCTSGKSMELSTSQVRFTCALCNPSICYKFMLTAQDWFKFCGHNAGQWLLVNMFVNFLDVVLVKIIFKNQRFHSVVDD